MIRQLQEKDVIFTITPHILRTPNVTEADLSPIWIGTEDDITLKSAPPISVFERQDVEPRDQPWEQGARVGGEQIPDDTSTKNLRLAKLHLEIRWPNLELFRLRNLNQLIPESEEEPGPPTSVPAEEVDPEAEPPTPQVEEDIPVEEPPQEQVEEPPQQQAEEPQSQRAVVPSVRPPENERGEEVPPEAVISFSSPNVNPPVGTDVVLNVQVEGAAKAGSISLFLSFDPASIQMKNVMQGPFVTPGAFTKSFR